MISAPVRAVMQVLDGMGEQPRTLFVGGCVRNELLGLPTGDIDLATQFTPGEVIRRLEDAGLKAVPTGIEHGTVTAVIERQGFEVTTLRRDVETNGRHAVVSFTQDWAEDAARRDFTLNTLLAAPAGRIFDPLGRGFEDLQARRILFVGDPATRIAEDYLRILRFFRFYAHYGQGPIDAAGLEACKEAAGHIKELSRERITQEILKLLQAGRAAEVLEIMFQDGVLADLPATGFEAGILKRLAGGSVLSKLFILGGMTAQDFDQYLILNNAQKRDLKRLAEAYQFLESVSETQVKKLIYYYKNKAALQAYLIRCAEEGKPPEETYLDMLQNWQPPVFPVTGEDLIAQGIPEGPELGQKLKLMEQEWLVEHLRGG